MTEKEKECRELLFSQLAVFEMMLKAMKNMNKMAHANIDFNSLEQSIVDIEKVLEDDGEDNQQS